MKKNVAAQIGKTGLVEIVVPKGGDNYVHEFDPQTHLALTKAMLRSVVGRVKDGRTHASWLRIVAKVQALTLDDLRPYPAKGGAK